MGYLSVPNFNLPRPRHTGGGTTSFLIDASAEKVAFVFRIPKTGTLESVGFRLGTVTQAPSNGLKISFQDVSATDGAPDGVVDEYRVVTAGLTSNTWVNTGIISSDGTDGGVKRSVTKGNILAVVVEFQSFSASDSLNLLGWADDPPCNGSSYVNHFTAAWAKSNAVSLAMAIKYTDGYSLIEGAMPFTTFGSHGEFNTTTTPDEIALKFKYPVPIKISGLWANWRPLGDMDLVLYDSNGTSVLTTVSLDKDIIAGVGSTVTFVPISSEIELLANTFYYLAYKPTTSTSPTVYYMEVNSAAIFDQVDMGQNFYWSQRTDAGSWSDTTTKRPLLGVVISSLHDGTGGGVSRSRVQRGM